MKMIFHTFIVLVIIGCSGPGMGVVFLKNNHKIVGRIETPWYYDRDNVLDSQSSPLRIQQVGGAKNGQTIYLSDVSIIKIPKKNNSDSVEYKPFGGTLAALIGEKYQYRLYCRQWIRQNMGNNTPLYSYSADIILTIGGIVLDQFETNRRASQRWLDYANFINKRYNLHLSKYYFQGKDEKVMIDYVLEKENEKQSSPPAASLPGR